MEQLLTAWADIQQEVADVSGDSEQKAYLSQLKEITRLKLKLQIIYDMVEMLRKVYYKPFADRLNKLLSLSLKFDCTNPESYQKELQRCLNRSGGFKIDLDLKELNFEQLKKKGQGVSKKPTREYYMEWLLRLSDHAKYQIQDSIMTYEFFSRIKQYNTYCEMMEKMHKK